MTDWSDYYSGQRVDSLARCVALRHHDARVGGLVPGLGSLNTVTLAPNNGSLAGNAEQIGLTSVQNTGDRVAVKGRQDKLTHECVKGCSGTSRYLRGEYVAGCVYDGLE